MTRKHYSQSWTFWGMAGAAAASLAVAIAGHKWPDWVPTAITEMATGSAVAALGSLALRFRSLSLTRESGRPAEGGCHGTE
ncbi:MAG: hypothetical protein AB1824_01265 [Acidobacteriota bacterium]